MRSLRFCLFAIVSAVATTAAFADDYTDPAGFSMWVPDNWVAITKTNRDGLPEATKKWIEDSKISLDKINVVVTPKDAGAAAPTLNIVVLPQALPINEQTAGLLGKLMPAQLKAAGMTVEDFKVGVEKVAGTDAIVATFKATIPALTKEMKQKQIYFPANDKTLIITHTAGVNDFPMLSPVFEKITGSIKVGAK